MKFKSITSFALALIISISVIPASTVNAIYSSPWMGSISSSLGGGSGTKADPYIVSSAEQFAHLAQLVNSGEGFYTEYETSDSYEMIPKYIRLTTDIDLNNIPFDPIGDPTDWETSSFFGCFDGGGHTITGFVGTYGLFGKTYGDSADPTSDLGRICNLNVVGKITCDYASADIGGIVGRAQGGVIENCSFTGSINVEDGGFYYIGGVVGEMESGFIFDCTSDTDITVTDNHRGVGGVLGGAEYTAPLMDGCSNSGDISVGGYMYAGGIVGKGNTVINSYNKGNIEFSNSDSQISGIAGYANAVTNCYNLGDLNGTNALQYAYIYGIAQSSEVYNCYNAGAINVTLADNHESYIFTLARGGENIFALTSQFPAYTQYNEETYWDENVYAGISESEMASASFKNSLNDYVSQNPEYTFEDYYDNTFTRTYSTWKSGNPYPEFGIDDPEMTLEAFSMAKDGAAIGQVSMSGTQTKFKSGDTVTLSAVYDNDGVDYRFIGWYANNDFTKVISTRKTYTFTVTDEMVSNGVFTLTALYEKVTLARITVNGGNLFTVEGEEYSSQFIDQYRPGKAITVWAKDETNFAYWINTDGKIASYEPRYTFIVAYDLTLTAVYNTKLADKYTVIFVSDYGQVMYRRQMTTDDVQSLEMPPVPVKTGYDAGTWSLDKTRILEAMQNGTDVITVTPVYPEIVKTANVTISGGTIVPDGITGGEYKINSQLTVQANAPASDMYFAYWQDGNGNVLSYNERYSFIVSGDIALEAVFTNGETDSQAIAEITSIVQQDSVGGISFTATFSAPEGSTINFAGIVATSDATKAENLTAENADYIRGGAQDKISGRFTWTKSQVSVNDVWYVRAYLIYTDANGITHTVYSSLVNASYNIL